jgi:phage/plasmid-like protein (TIGR03299 family)
MAHQLMEYDTMVSARGLIPWHQSLGELSPSCTVTDEVLDTPACRKKSGLEWNVAKRKLAAIPEGPNDPILRGERELAEFEERPPRPTSAPLDGFVGLFRDDIWLPLSVVSDLYQPFQNDKLFEVLDPLVKDGTLAYETAGSLRNGRQVWVMCRFPQADAELPGGDRIEGFLLVTNSHDGTRRVVATPSLVRVVCANTMEQALSRGSVYSTSHVGSVDERMELAVNMISGASGDAHRMLRDFECMQQIELTDERLAEYYASVFPDAHTETGRAQATVVAQRGTCDAWRMASENLTVGGYNPRSLWAAYCSVTRFATHIVGSRVKDAADHQINGGGSQLRRAAHARAIEMIG